MRNLLIILKNIRKRKLLNILRLLSLVIGFSVVLYIIVLNKWESSFDTFWEGHEQIYRVTLQETKNGELVSNSAKNFNGSIYLLKEEIPGIESVCGFGKDVITVFYNEKQINEVNWLWSDTTFFRVFPREIVDSYSSDFFVDMHGVMISKSFAVKLFGNDNPINKKIRLNEGWEFFINGVFEDLPANSHLNIDVIGSNYSLRYYIRNFDNASGTLVENPEFKTSEINPYSQGAWRTPVTYRPYCYLKLGKNTSVQSIESRVETALEKVSFPPQLTDSQLKFIFQPVSDIYLKSNLENEFKENGSISRLYFLYLIAFVVMIVCTINFLNLTTILTIENGKQFAVRILNGARLNSIFGILLFDNLIVTAMAFGASVITVLWVISEFNPQISFYFSNLIVLFFITVFIAVLSAILPYYSSLKNNFQTYLKTQTNSLPGTWKGRKSLIVFQFAITFILIATTLMINKQLLYMSQYDLGFKPQQTIFSYSPVSMNNKPDIPQRLKTFENLVMNLPGITEFAVSSSIPGKEVNRNVSNLMLEINDFPVSTSFNVVSINEGYVPLFNIELLAGRNFSNQADWQSDEILVNEYSTKLMGFSSVHEAVGQFLKMGNSSKKIVGVINDYHHLSLKNSLSPMLFTQDLNWNHSVGYYTLKYDKKREKEILKTIPEIWKSVYPEETAMFQFTDSVYASQYEAEQRFNKLLTIGSVIALLISCIGLFAITSFETKKRIREIGVRKVNGASALQILGLLNRDLTKLIFVSFLIAVPVSYYLLKLWLNNFAYKTTLSWWIFLLAGISGLAIGIMTVLLQSYKPAISNPVDALKNE